MPAEFTGEEIIDLCGARLAQGMMPDQSGSICSDSRIINEGEWFIALQGPAFDGHDFIGEAFSETALGCIVGERGSYPIASTSFPLIAVEDTYEAYQQLARNWRKRLNPRVVAVSGSRNEPSHVLHLIANVLEQKFNLLIHEEGTRESLYAAEVALTGETQVMVVKVCPEELNHAEQLGRALAPTVVVLTEDGFEHLRASNESAIARAECDLLVHLEKGRGVSVISKRSQDLLHRIKYHFPERAMLFDTESIKAMDDQGTTSRFIIPPSDQVFECRTACSAADIWSVVMTCRQFGFTDSEIAHTLAHMR